MESRIGAPTPTPRSSALARGLDVTFVVAAVTSLLGPFRALQDGYAGQAAVSVILTGAAGLLWIARARHGSTAATVGFVVVTVAAASVPEGGSTYALLCVLATLVVSLDHGFRVAVGVTVLITTVLTVSVLVSYAPPTSGLVFETAAVTMVLLMGAGVGRLMRTTEQARAEAAAVGAGLIEANLRLRRSLSLERELVLAEERARSARELHDGLGHSLTLVAMALEFAERTKDRDAERAWSEVATAAETNRRALADMRLWVRALDPPVPADGMGGPAAFDAIADAFRGTGLEVRVRHHGDKVALPDEASLFATRFVQEGLTNVLRHAGAEVVEIEVRQSPHQARLTIGDDGRRAPSTTEGFGLRSLRERAELLGGSVRHGRSALGGFELSATLPLQTGG